MPLPFLPVVAAVAGAASIIGAVTGTIVQNLGTDRNPSPVRAPTADQVDYTRRQFHTDLSTMNGNIEKLREQQENFNQSAVMGFNAMQNRVTDVERFGDEQRSINASTSKSLKKLNLNQHHMFEEFQNSFEQHNKNNQVAIQTYNGLQSRTTALEKVTQDQFSSIEFASRSVALVSAEQQRQNRELLDFYGEQQTINQAVTQTYSGLQNRTSDLEKYSKEQRGINESSCRSIARLSAKQKNSNKELINFYSDQRKVNQAAIEALNRVQTRTDALEVELFEQRSTNESNSRNIARISAKQKRLSREVQGYVESQNKFNQSAADTLNALQAKMDDDGKKQSRQVQQLVAEQSKVNEDTEEKCTDFQNQMADLKEMLAQLISGQMGHNNEEGRIKAKARSRVRTKKTMKSRNKY